MLKMRSQLILTMMSILQEKGFQYIQPPIITKNDCEGNGEVLKIEQSKVLFGADAFLTVSTQLHAESVVAALDNVFTFGPTFRAENSQTRRHLSEFWMLEVECSSMFQLDQLMNCVEKLLRETALRILATKAGTSALAALNTLHYFRLSTEMAILFLNCFDVRLKNRGPGHDFDYGDESALTSLLKAPTFLFGFPRQFKAFYTRKGENTIRETESFDLLLPGVGEVVGGTLREANYAQIKSNLRDKGQNDTGLDWYLELRREGWTTTGGFGLGFERLVMYVLGIDNIRDAIMAPRHPGQIFL